MSGPAGDRYSIAASSRVGCHPHQTYVRPRRLQPRCHKLRLARQHRPANHLTMETLLHSRHVVKNTRPVHRQSRSRHFVSFRPSVPFSQPAMDAAPRLALGVSAMDDRSTGRCGCRHGPRKKSHRRQRPPQKGGTALKLGGFGELRTGLGGEGTTPRPPPTSMTMVGRGFAPSQVANTVHQPKSFAMFIILCPRQNCHLFNLLFFFSRDLRRPWSYSYSPLLLPLHLLWVLASCLSYNVESVDLTANLGLQVPIHVFAHLK